MNGRPTIEEQYKKGNEVINYVVYKSKTGAGNDEVLQHKIMGTTETAHITLHPDGEGVSTHAFASGLLQAYIAVAPS